MPQPGMLSRQLLPWSRLEQKAPRFLSPLRILSPESEPQSASLTSQEAERSIQCFVKCFGHKPSWEHGLLAVSLKRGPQTISLPIRWGRDSRCGSSPAWAPRWSAGKSVTLLKGGRQKSENQRARMTTQVSPVPAPPAFCFPSDSLHKPYFWPGHRRTQDQSTTRSQRERWPGSGPCSSPGWAGLAWPLHTSCTPVWTHIPADPGGNKTYVSISHKHTASPLASRLPPNTDPNLQ